MNKNKVIISNIGNRNITFDGKMYNEIFPSKESQQHTTFRKFTFDLLKNNGDSEYLINPLYRERIGLNIIQLLIDKYREDTKLIVLCSSNQKGSHNQDTVYEALIMKELIEDQYGIPVEIREINCSVINSNLLMKRYRQILSWLIRNYDSCFFHICDAGGTPQQKFSLKLITEFLLGEDRYKVEYVKPNNTIEEMPPIEYRNIIARMQAESLIKLCDFDAALALFNSSAKEAGDASGTNYFQRFISIGSYVFRNNYRRAANLTKNLKNHYFEKYSFLSSLSNLEPFGNFDLFSEIIDKKEFFYCCEKLSRAQYFFRIGKYSDSILNFSIFYETYLNAALLKRFDVSKTSSYEEKMKVVYKNIVNDFPEIEKEFELSRVSSIPFKLVVLEKVTIPKSHYEFISLIKPHISGIPGNESGNFGNIKTVNYVRNKIAHEGLEVNQDYIDNKLAYYGTLIDSISNLFELPSMNFYDSLNKAIISLMKS